ncbi:MAG: hypothetical protein LBD29_00505 [Treponema sp.]|jgi:YD repeat-containing protein|nr:hypothetical protein [Treponema sp.]
MSRFFLLVVIFLGSFSYMWGQPGREQAGTAPETETFQETEASESEPEETTDPPELFPLGPILVSSLQKAVPWGPDWVLTMPPDGFRVSSGLAVSITLSIDEETYQVRWNDNGSLKEFPFVLPGGFVQIQCRFKSSGGLQGLVISASDQAWQVDFIGNQEDPLSLARITTGDAVYFAGIHYDPINISETWYDPEGTVLANFTSRSYYAGKAPRFLTLTSRQAEEEETTDWYYYDSFGNISEIRRADRVFSALYTQEQRPRYWKQERITGSDADIAKTFENYTLQWNEQGLLVRISETSSSGEQEAADIRYEYTLDAQGNWTERREIRMTSQLGVLAPVPGGTVRRVISYKTGG